MSQTIETGNRRVVSLKIELPRGIALFLGDLCRFGGYQLSLKEWAERELVQAARATIDTLDDGEYLQATRLKERYGLSEEKNSEEDC